MPEAARALLRAAALTLPGDTARLDAELLLAAVTGLGRAQLLLGDVLVSGEQQRAFAALLARRRAHEPLAYILGEREFWSLTLRVTPAVLIPRPDSETLIEAACAHFVDLAPGRVLDLGTGSGALLLAALSEWPDAVGVGVDRSAGALLVAGGNAARLGMADRVTLLLSDWAEKVDGRFDLILCNPPYIGDGTVLMPDVADFEPSGALFGGADGLDAYRLLLPQMAGLLAPDGVALFEFGVGQAEALLAMAADAGLRAALRADLSGRARALLVQH